MQPSIFDYKAIAKQQLANDVYAYLVGGADDMRTLQRNQSVFEHYQIRPRRLRDVSVIDTSVQLFDNHWNSPILLAPVGFQGMFHEGGELATAAAANQKGHQMIVSTVSNAAYAEVAQQMERKPWFQLYTTTNLQATQTMIQRAENNGCEAIVLTVDVPVLGNRNEHARRIIEERGLNSKLGNLDGLIQEKSPHNPHLTWAFIDWFREQTKMKLIIKGIMTAEDAEIAREKGVDGIIVSNHGGRQLESDCSTLECLEEVRHAVGKDFLVLIDGGIRRGTDIFKALALGADAVCIGRAYIYGLVANGTQGVMDVIDILQSELVRNMQLAGVRHLSEINRSFVREKRW